MKPAPLPGEMPANRLALIGLSHRRSVEIHRLDPLHREPRVLSRTELQDHVAPLDPFLSVARSGMHSLYHQVRDAGYVVLLTDPHGVAVEFVANPIIDRQARNAGLLQGGCWTEDHEGTCAVGLALVDQMAFTVHHDEHFRLSNRSLTCSAGPIFDSEGRLIGVLDVSALESPSDPRSQQLALSMVYNTARMIENAYFMRQYAHQLVLKTSLRREFLEITTEGLLALDPGGHVIACNQSFEHDSCIRRGRLTGMSARELFGVESSILMDTLKSHADEPMRLRIASTGSHLFALARQPHRPPLVSPGRSEATLRGKQPDDLSRLAGLDPMVQEQVSKAMKVLNKDIPILLLGESGTGKELFARAIHACGDRARCPFVVVDCSSIPETLVESELFGYVQGAFTGAKTKGAQGKIVQAHRGTLFLDEIGDMPLSMQSRLLRVLAEREVTPLGSELSQRVDFQVISATHQDLAAMVEHGAFRLDLYYRLNGLTLNLPALRERPDLAYLIDRLLTEESTRLERPTPRVSELARRVLMEYPWPGNIRQLRNTLRTAAAMCDAEQIDVEHLPREYLQKIGGLYPPPRLFSRQMDEPPLQTQGNAQRRDAHRLTQLLSEHDWNVTRAARALGVNRSTIYRRMAAFNIVEPNRRARRQDAL